MSHNGTHTQLGLLEKPEAEVVTGYWIGPLVALGARLSRNYGRYPGRQLVVAVSVPTRAYAATLIASGWILNSQPTTLPAPIEVFRAARRGDRIRVVNRQFVIVDKLNRFDDSSDAPRVQLGGSFWDVDRLLAAAPASSTESIGRSPRPEPGSLEHMSGMNANWNNFLARPAADLALVGTVSWLEEDMWAYLGREGYAAPPSRLHTIIRPKREGEMSWYSRIYPSTRFGEALPLPTALKISLLDGNGAISYLSAVQTPIVVCVVDRSVADEAGAALIIQQRNTHGEPISVEKDLGWKPPAGIECLGFTVAL